MRFGFKVGLIAALGCAFLRAQAPPPKTTPPPPTKKIVWATVAGVAAGALIGTRGLTFAQLPPSERGAHELRAGLTYGAIGGVLTAAGATRWFAGPATPSHDFFWDRWNTPLFLGIAAVQGLDFSSTRYFRDRGKDEWLLTNHLVDNRPAFAATEVAAGAAGIGLSYLLHRSGHHRLERWVAAGYIAVGIASAVANYRYPAVGHAIF